MKMLLAAFGLLNILLGTSVVCAQEDEMSSIYPDLDPAKPVNLGAAGHFVILTETGITDVPASNITGNVGVSPTTGASDLLTCPEVHGKIYSVDAAGPQPCNKVRPVKLSNAVSDMDAAYTDAAGRPAKHINVGGGNIGGRTLKPGVYRWDTDVSVQANVKLLGGQNDVWIFQVSKNLLVSVGKHVRLRGQAQPQNVFWQIAGHVSLGAQSHIAGVILCKTAIAMGTGASIHGRLLAQTAATLEMNKITVP